MSVAMTEAVDLMKNLDESEIFDVINYIKENKVKQNALNSQKKKYDFERFEGALEKTYGNFDADAYIKELRNERLLETISK